MGLVIYFGPLVASKVLAMSAIFVPTVNSQSFPRFATVHSPLARRWWTRPNWLRLFSNQKKDTIMKRRT